MLDKIDRRNHYYVKKREQLPRSFNVKEAKKVSKDQGLVPN